MSKFSRVTEGKFIRVSQFNTGTEAPIVGKAPLDLAAPAAAENPFTPQSQSTPKPVSAPNYFEKAGINPLQYTGTAEQNERLRQVIDPSARTFYDAYVKNIGNGKWSQHPSERINKLRGTPQPVKPKITPAAPTPAPKVPTQTAFPPAPSVAPQAPVNNSINTPYVPGSGNNKFFN